LALVTFQAARLESAHNGGTAKTMTRVSHIVLPVLDVQKSRDWYVNKLGFSLERDSGDAAGIQDISGLTIFLMKAAAPLAGPKVTLTIQVASVASKYEDLTALGVNFVSPPQRQVWGYGAEVLDPDGYMNHLWDEATMMAAMREMSGKSLPHGAEE
jgi:catechol 2,3-dioxygenase-like lactoylglutathione lyase family enzyme